MYPWCVKIIQRGRNAKNQNLNFVLIVSQLVILKVLFTCNSPQVKLSRILDIFKYTHSPTHFTYLVLEVDLKFSSVHSHSTIIYDYISHLGNLEHSCESIVTLAVASYPNIPLVHSIPSPSKMNSKLSFLMVTTSFHVDQITIWEGWRYPSTEHHYYLNTCRNHRA